MSAMVNSALRAIKAGELPVCLEEYHGAKDIFAELHARYGARRAADIERAEQEAAQRPIDDESLEQRIGVAREVERYLGGKHVHHDAERCDDPSEAMSPPANVSPTSRSPPLLSTASCTPSHCLRACSSSRCLAKLRARPLLADARYPCEEPKSILRNLWASQCRGDSRGTGGRQTRNHCRVASAAM